MKNDIINIHPAFSNTNPIFTCKLTDILQHGSTLELLGGVYQIRNTETNKIYIGSSHNLYDRVKNHLSSLKRNKNIHKLQTDWNTYDTNQPFVFEVLKTVRDNTDREMLYNIEQIYLDLYKPHIDGYNTAPKSEIVNKYKSKTKRNDNVALTRDIEIHRYNCLQYIANHPNDNIEPDFWYKEKKMTLYVHHKLRRLYIIYPIFYQAIIDHVLPKFDNMRCKLKVVGWTIFLNNLGWPVFRIRGKDKNNNDIRFDMDYDELLDYQQELNMSVYEVFSAAFHEDERIRNHVYIVEKNKKI